MYSKKTPFKKYSEIKTFSDQKKMYLLPRELHKVYTLKKRKTSLKKGTRFK